MDRWMEGERKWSMLCSRGSMLFVQPL